MTTMLEKMARALCETDADGLTYEQQARAALEAIREPPPELAGPVFYYATSTHLAAEHEARFTAMIDAILAQK